jgi:hypothetical protein
LIEMSAGKFEPTWEGIAADDGRAEGNGLHGRKSVSQ